VKTTSIYSPRHQCLRTVDSATEICIDEAKYCHIVSLNAILHATPLTSNVGWLVCKPYIDQVRQITQDPSIEILRLNLKNNTYILYITLENRVITISSEISDQKI